MYHWASSIGADELSTAALEVQEKNDDHRYIVVGYSARREDSQPETSVIDSVHSDSFHEMITMESYVVNSFFPPSSQRRHSHDGVCLGRGLRPRALLVVEVV